MCHIYTAECAHVDVKSNFLWNEKMYFECPCRLQNRLDKLEHLVKLKFMTNFDFVTKLLKLQINISINNINDIYLTNYNQAEEHYHWYTII